MHTPFSTIDMELLFVDMDGVLVDFYQGIRLHHPEFDHLEAAEQRKITAAMSATPGFFTSLKPMPHAVEAFQVLSTHFDTYILSTPDWYGVNSWTEKRIWVEEHLGDAAFKRLILTHNKGLFSGRALIDDRLRNGVDQFQGEHIHFGTQNFPDWPHVLRYLLADAAAGQPPSMGSTHSHPLH